MYGDNVINVVNTNSEAALVQARTVHAEKEDDYIANGEVAMTGFFSGRGSRT